MAPVVLAATFSCCDADVAHPSLELERHGAVEAATTAPPPFDKPSVTDPRESSPLRATVTQQEHKYFNNKCRKKKKRNLSLIQVLKIG